MRCSCLPINGTDYVVQHFYPHSGTGWSFCRRKHAVRVGVVGFELQKSFFQLMFFFKFEEFAKQLEELC